jgi:dynein heavy chain
MLDDHILKAQTMHSSAYIKPFEEEMKTWEDKLISMQVKFIFSVYFSILIGAAKYQHLKPIFLEQNNYLYLGVFVYRKI